MSSNFFKTCIIVIFLCVSTHCKGEYNPESNMNSDKEVLLIFSAHTGWTAKPIGTGASGSPSATVTKDLLNKQMLKVSNPGITAGGNNIHRGISILSPKGLGFALNPNWNRIIFSVILNDVINRNNYTELSAYDTAGKRIIFDGLRVTSSTKNVPKDGYYTYEYELWFEPKTAGNIVINSFKLDFWLNNERFAEKHDLEEISTDLATI